MNINIHISLKHTHILTPTGKDDASSKLIKDHKAITRVHTNKSGVIWAYEPSTSFLLHLLLIRWWHLTGLSLHHLQASGEANGALLSLERRKAFTHLKPEKDSQGGQKKVSFLSSGKKDKKCVTATHRGFKFMSQIHTCACLYPHLWMSFI